MLYNTTTYAATCMRYVQYLCMQMRAKCIYNKVPMPCEYRCRYADVRAWSAVYLAIESNDIKNVVGNIRNIKQGRVSLMGHITLYKECSPDKYI